MANPLIWIRAIHFAATLSVSGAVFFLAFIGGPTFRAADNNGRVSGVVRAWLVGIVWVGLAFVVISGGAWLVLQAEQMSDLPLAGVISEGILWTVLSGTDFGYDWMVRLALTVLLVGVLYPFDFTELVTSHRRRGAAVALAAGLVGTLAFAGHAGAGSGIEGAIHLTSDILHLVAAAAWIGSLLPLAVLLGAAHLTGDEPSKAIACTATLRFSALGMVTVGTLVATGIVNSWELAGSVPALFGTDYGRLLLVKVALFLVMLSIAAVNRLHLTPRLVQRLDASTRQHALRQLRINSLIEAGVAAIIVFIVGVLGTLPPGLDE